MNGHVEAVRELLKCGRRLTNPSKRADAEINMLDSQRRTALHLAAANDAPSVLHHLIGAGVDLAAKNRVVREPPLNLQGQTALHLCSGEIFTRKLLRSGADVGLVDSTGKTPLHTASERGNVAKIKLLLEHGLVYC